MCVRAVRIDIPISMVLAFSTINQAKVSKIVICYFITRDQNGATDISYRKGTLRVIDDGSDDRIIIERKLQPITEIQ